MPKYLKVTAFESQLIRFDPADPYRGHVPFPDGKLLNVSLHEFRDIDPTTAMAYVVVVSEEHEEGERDDGDGPNG